MVVCSKSSDETVTRAFEIALTAFGTTLVLRCKVSVSKIETFASNCREHTLSFLLLHQRVVFGALPV